MSGFKDGGQVIVPVPLEFIGLMLIIFVVFSVYQGLIRTCSHPVCLEEVCLFHS